MFLNILGESRLHFLEEILAAPPVANAYLAGGTALALMLGHRESADFDWFSPAMFDAEVVAGNLSKLGQLRIAETKKGTFHGFVNGIRVTWLYYPNPLLAELVAPPDIPGLQMASLTDIAVMKWAALSSRGSRKDFIDLYFIARAGLGIAALLPLLPRKFPNANINYYHMIKSLSYFDDAELEAPPLMHEPAPWEEIKAFFGRQQKLLLGRCLEQL